MADNNKTDTGNIPAMDNTKTRKTLKLKPLAGDAEQDAVEPVIDPLTIRNTETGPLGTMDDTRTRKTVKLKATKTGIITLEDTPKVELKTVIDPLTIRNTETGPLGAMVDTRTRKTVKLKPLKTAGDGKENIAPGEPETTSDAKPSAGSTPTPASPVAATPEAPKTDNKEAVAVSKAPASEDGILKDTNTRKTLKLKVVTPGETKAPVPADGMLKDTNTRKTLKLKAVTPGETKAPVLADGMLKDTNTRKTLKLKMVTPGETKPVLSSDSSAGKVLQDTNTRKTLKLKVIKPEEEKASEVDEAPPVSPAITLPKVSEVAAPPEIEVKEAAEAAEDTRTQNVNALSTDTTGVSKVEANHTDDDTIKIERPKPKPDAMPLPSLGAPAAAKTVNNKETVKLRPSSAVPQGAPSDEVAAKASKATIKLSPPLTAKPPETPEAKNEEAEAVADESPKPKLTIGKAPPPKTPPKEEEAPPEKPGGLKLKSMAPKTEAPRAAADQEKIKEKKKGKTGGKSQASPVYAAVAVITLVLVAFSVLATTAQFFDLWQPESPVGKQIVPHVKSIMDSLMKAIIK